MRLRFRRISRVLIRRSWYCVSNVLSRGSWLDSRVLIGVVFLAERAVCALDISFGSGLV